MAWNNRYPLILNPNARSERAKKAQSFIMQNATEFVMYASKSAEEAAELTRHLTKSGEPVIITAGGDGTINNVVREIAGTDTALGILPTGTMNVFARELGVPSADLPVAMDIIREGNVQEVDLFEVNGNPFIQMAGIGFDARVIEETSSESKKFLGPLAYGIAATKVFGESPPHIQVQFAEGNTADGVCVLVGNGSLYGGQFKLFGHADNSDNLLDVVIFKEKGYQVILDFLQGLASSPNQGVFTGTDRVEYFQTSGMSIQADKEIPYEIDGEYSGRDTNFIFTPNCDKHIKVITPNSPVTNEWQETLSALAPFMPWSQ